MSRYYVRSVSQECQTDGCRKVASVEVCNARNARIGLYCARHGESVAAKLNANVQEPDISSSPAWANRRSL